MAYHYFPGSLIYAMTKVFLRYFSLGLSKELQCDKENIDMMVYEPAFVSTKLSRAKEGLLNLNTMYAAEGALIELGLGQE